MMHKLEKILESVQLEGNKVVISVVVSYLLGLTTGAIGKGIGGDWRYLAPLVLPTIDLIGGCAFAVTYVPYALGVATNYIKEICEVTCNIS